VRTARFQDRRDAGRQLAAKLSGLMPLDPMVLGLPRGGVPVAAPIADRLRAPLDVFIARKVGAPHNREFGIGAVVEGSDLLVLTDAARRLGIGEAQLGELVERARSDVTQRVQTYRGTRPLPHPAGRDVILVDDGLATGVTAEAALLALRQQRPRRLILAVPVGARTTVQRLAGLADDIVCLHSAARFISVGAWYLDFRPVSDAEVIRLLDRPAGAGAQR
jgi:putative phosphoribosyl transferase